MTQDLVPVQGGLAAPEAGQSIQLADHVSLVQTGLLFTDGATPEELARAAQGFDRMQRLTGFAVGDLANFYREHFPERFQEWLQSYPVETKHGELDQKTIKVYAATMAFFPHEIRARFLVEYAGRRALSFSHFQRVKRYGMDKALYWLERAASEDLTIDMMTALIDEGTPGTDEHPPIPSNYDSHRFSAEFPYFYQLGPHRLIVGDSTDPAVIAGLFAGDERASMIWTDPPYGVDYIEKISQKPNQRKDVHVPGLGRPEIVGDTPLLARELMRDAFTVVQPYLVESCPVYVAGPSGDMVVDFIGVFGDVGWTFKQTLVWVKQQIVMGRMDYHWQHEFIFYGHTPGAPSQRMGSGRDFRWHGPDNASSVFNVDRPHASKEHPTMKPTKLIVPMIENSSRPDEIVLDCFAGSGSTMIAAELTGRRAFMVEYDERYADVIRQRYVDFVAEQERAHTERLEAHPIVEAVVHDSMPQE